MQRIIALFTLSLLVVSCGSSATKKADTAADLIKVERTDYTISFSKEWDETPSENPNIDFVLAAQPDGKMDRFSENITILIQEVGDTMSLEKFGTLTKSQLEQYMPNSETVKSTIKNVNGTKCLEMEYKGLQNQYNLYFIQDVYLKNKKAYILTFTAEQGSIQAYRSMAQKVLSSFRLN